MLIDLFPAFLEYWDKVKSLPIDEQIEEWANDYLSTWPELLEKQVDDYRTQNLDWRDIAREKIFPFLPQRLDAMRAAHANLLSLCEPTFTKARQILKFDSDLVFVIYVGIGCGAGWATTFQNTPAILFGLENIAECGWEQEDSLAGLIAHELGHVVHHHWRSRFGKPLDDTAWSQLLDEGFAQYCQNLIVQENKFHQGATQESADWLTWCQDHKTQLASEFLRTVDANEPVSKFFGSWLEIDGHSETGYFLGYEVIRNLLGRGFSLQEIALLNPEEYARPILEEMA